jgi:uncharacterized membrane protein
VTYQIVKFAHVLGAVALLGTGAGIAFFMLMAHRSGDVRLIAGVAGIVVIADALFTASAIVAQPLTGFWLAQASGASLADPWLSAALALYLVAGALWLPVVWIQIQLRDLARQAARTSAPLPDKYHRLFRVWFAFGFPGFGATLAILWLMIAKPGA